MTGDGMILTINGLELGLVTVGFLIALAAPHWDNLIPSSVKDENGALVCRCSAVDVQFLGAQQVLTP